MKYRSIYSCIESYRRIFWGIGKYRITSISYRIVTNHPIYTPNSYPLNHKALQNKSHCSAALCVVFPMRRWIRRNPAKLLQMRNKPLRSWTQSDLSLRRITATHRWQKLNDKRPVSITIQWSNETVFTFRRKRTSLNQRRRQKKILMRDGRKLRTKWGY